MIANARTRHGTRFLTTIDVDGACHRRLSILLRVITRTVCTTVFVNIHYVAKPSLVSFQCMQRIRGTNARRITGILIAAVWL